MRCSVKSVAVSLAAFAFMSLAFAIDRSGISERLSPSQREWTRNLTNRSGKVRCCDEADGWNALWKADANGYQVFIENEWHPVPDEALLLIPNRLGVPFVWYTKVAGKVEIRCFLPGGGL